MPETCTHGVGAPCDNPDAIGRRDFTAADIDRQSDYGYGGERHLMRSAQAGVDAAVVKAANAARLTDCELAEWLCSKLGRWSEDSGWFWRRAEATRDHAAHRPTAADKLMAARLSIEDMRTRIREGGWF
jgi:hypothetical protein